MLSLKIALLLKKDLLINVKNNPIKPELVSTIVI